MRTKRFELSRLAALAPQTSMSAIPSRSPVVVSGPVCSGRSPFAVTRTADIKNPTPRLVLRLLIHQIVSRYKAIK